MKQPIRLDQRLSDFLSVHPETRPVFETHGLGPLVSEDVVRAIGPFLTVETALLTHGISPREFVCLLATGESPPEPLDGAHLLDTGGRKPATLMSLMPCGLKMPFARDFEGFVDAFVKQGNDPITCILESNLNHEISYYPYVSHMETIATLPDIVVSSDFNTFFHHRFYDRFVKPGYFTDVTDYAPQETFVKAGIPDPEKNVTIVCVNPLIVVADLEKTGNRPLPRQWENLLDPMWTRDITLRGGEHFFCHAVLLPFYKAFGDSAMEALARNVYDGRHPSQMAKTAGTGRSAALYVMPYFFSRRIPPNRKVRIIWPEDGALASPVTLMVKKDKAAELKPVTDYLTGESMARVFAGAGFPSPHPAVVNDIPEHACLNWLGWDYMREHDLEQLNKDIDRIFLPTVYPRTGP